MGYVIFFKEQYIHLMYGSKPSNYQLNVKEMPGVREGCSESLEVVNETLYYVGRNGVYSYDGAVPKKISDCITGAITAAAASQQDAKYYLSCLKDGVRTLLVYDPLYDIWDVEDDTEFKFSAYGDGKLWYIDGSNQLRTITGNLSETVLWSVESGDLRESSLDQKYISRAKFNLEMDAGSVADIYFSYDEDPLWHRAGTIYSVSKQTYVIPLVAKRCGRFRWKIEGRGQAKILAMGITVEGGTETGGTVQSWRRR